MNREQEIYQYTFTFPAETLFSVLISSIRVSRSGVSSIYCIACWTIEVTAYTKADIPIMGSLEKTTYPITGV